MADNVERVKQKLTGQVPLVAHMGVKLVKYENRVVIVEAPLEANINTHGTAFAGSLYSVAAMAGWSLTHLSLMDAGFKPKVMIARGEVDYKKPVTSDIRARACVDEETLETFVETFREKGKAKLGLRIEIESEGGLAMTLEAVYAAMT